MARIAVRGRKAKPSREPRGPTERKAPAHGESATSPPYGFHVDEVWIPVRDGIRLAANLFLPEGAPAEQRFPPLLEYLPYHKDDGTIARDYPIHGYFARRGYVGVRVDMRGTGRSEGRLPDREYSTQEHADALEVIDWLARQPWSNGHVGMFGLSWGGFNSIQVAGLRPPALKAIIAIEATEDLFHDDIHYLDGILHMDQYELEMDQFTPQTRAPDFPLDEASLADRFDVPPWKIEQLRHQQDGPFWRRPSILGKYERFRIPALLIAGWYDGYRDSVPRMLEHVRSPVKAIVGPWAHAWPHSAVPGPAIEWRREAVRWWDHWLKGIDTGALDEPRLAIFVRHSHPPDPGLREIPGEWRFEDTWPVPRIREDTWVLGEDHSLKSRAGSGAIHELEYVPSIGIEAGPWWGDLVPDQAPLDRRCLVYDSPPLDGDIEILGFPRALLRASVTAPLAHWFVRLSDIAPDESVTLVTGAGQNGAHRTSALRPESLPPDRVLPLEVPLHFTSWVFPRGHRIRLAISNALWPMAWPTPHRMTARLHVGGDDPSRVALPVVPREARPSPDFRPPEPSDKAPGVRSFGGVWPGSWTVHRDADRRDSILEWHGTGGMEFPWGREDYDERLRYTVDDSRPDRAAIEGFAETVIRRGRSRLTWRVHLDLRSDAAVFHYRLTRELLRGSRVVRRRAWREDVSRDYQ